MREDLPTGTVTFVFTDVEGSTRLLDQLGMEAYGALLAEHHRVCREAWAAHGGVEIDTAGDAFFVAFSRPSDALAAAAAAQEALASAGVRVRMGVHTGEVSLSETGYVGMEVHRAARIAAAGHGGQVLVSSATAALVEAALSDLGEHRFKDLGAPERVFQLGSGAFPPLESLYRSNLPVPTTPFLGREAELSAAVEMLSEAGARLVSLTGPGGSGKTRLALQASAEASDGFPGGVFWVPLAPLRDPQLILSEVATAVGVREGESGSAVSELASALAGRRLLVLLDNMEHLLPEARGQVGPFVAACPTVTIVVTSRERLQLPGERIFSVPPMSETDAETLFRRRAADVGADLAESDELRTLCARLDNLPLALELAAARMVVFGPAQLLERLPRRLDLLSGGRGGDARQETLRATIAWSHDLLDHSEQQLFRRLSVFAGGCSYESAEQVADAELDTLQSLLDKSLLRRRDSTVGPRFWMLETIHEYARERLEESGETRSLVHRLGEWLLEAADSFAAERKLGQTGSVARLEVELDNIRSTIGVALDWPDDPLVLRLSSALGWFWSASGRRGEALHWATEALERGKNLPDAIRVEGLGTAAAFAVFEMDTERAVRFGLEALELRRALRDNDGVADALRWLGDARALAGQTDEARRLLTESIALQEQVGDALRLARTLTSLAYIELDAGDAPAAVELFERALELAQAEKANGLVGDTLHSLGDAALMQGDAVNAARFYIDAINTVPAADALHRQYCLAGLAAAAALEGQAERAGHLWGAIESYQQGAEVHLDHPTAHRYEAILANVEGPPFAAAATVGRAITLEQAIEETLATRKPTTEAPTKTTR